MAEFLNRPRPQRRKDQPGSGFNAMGKPVPMFRRQAALDHCKAMGLTDTQDAWACVGRMSEALERDEPYKAMEAGMVYLDLTGTYRLMAVLLSAEPITPRKT